MKIPEIVCVFLNTETMGLPKIEQGVNYSNSIFERCQIFRLPVEQLNIGLDPGDAAARTGQMRLFSGFTFSRNKVSLMVPTQKRPFIQNN